MYVEGGGVKKRDGRRQYRRDGRRQYGRDGRRQYGRDGRRQYGRDGSRQYGRDGRRQYGHVEGGKGITTTQPFTPRNISITTKTPYLCVSLDAKEDVLLAILGGAHVGAGLLLLGTHRHGVAAGGKVDGCGDAAEAWRRETTGDRGGAEGERRYVTRKGGGERDRDRIVIRL